MKKQKDKKIKDENKNRYSNEDKNEKQTYEDIKKKYQGRMFIKLQKKNMFFHDIKCHINSTC